MNYSPLSRRALLLALFATATCAARAQNIGVGTLTPSERLDVVGGNLKLSTAGSRLIFPDGTSQTTAANGTGTVVVDNADSNTGTAANFLRFGGSGSGEGIGSKRNAGGNAYGLDFYAGFTNRMTVTNGGNVGIGTSSPFSRLSMGGTDNANAPGGRFAIYENANGQNFYGLGLVQNTGGLYGTGLWGSSGSALPYSGSAGGTLPQLFVQGNGNVGVGTISPRGQFDVAGTGDTYLTSNPANSGGQSLFLAGHIFVAPFGGGTYSYIQARGVANQGFVFRTNSGGNYVETLTLNPNGTASFAGNVTSPGGFTNTSDARFKENVRPLAGALASVLSLRGVRYTWNALGVQRGGTAGAGQVGLIAQELEKFYPELVVTDAAGYKSVNYAQLTPVLIEALKEQQQQIETLKAQNAAFQTAKAQADADHASLLTMQQQLARLLGDVAPATAQARK